MADKLPNYGGQAIIEGVLMRGAKTKAIAVRSPENEIIIETDELNSMYSGFLSKVPFLRGLLLLWDALVLGIQALTFSANIQTGEDEPIEGKELFFTLAISLLLGIGLFFLLPAGAAHLAESYFGWNNIIGNVLEGFLRLALLIGYMFAIGRIPDVNRVFSYHGAEHKTINAFEAGSDMSIESIRSFPRLHPRCGTAFLLTVAVLSIILFSLLGEQTLIARLLSRLAMIPVLAGISYEYIRFTGNIMHTSIGKMLSAPNLALQKLTTNEPDDDMLEVGIAAFNAMRSSEAALLENHTAITA